MAIQLPPYKFDSSLRDYPENPEVWSAFINDLFTKLKTIADETEKLEIYEYLGMALRIANRFDEAESYFLKALALSNSPSKKIQNLIRLAHVYQWEKEFLKTKVLFDQVLSLVNENEISASLIAAYHQHLGKFYYDQGYLSLATAEFELALNIRISIKAPQDQVESTLFALAETRKKLV